MSGDILVNGFVPLAISHGCATASRQVTVQGECRTWKPLPKMQYIYCTYRIFLAAGSVPIAVFIKN